MTTHDPEFFDNWLTNHGEIHPDDESRWQALYEENMQREAVDMIAHLKDMLEQFHENNLEAACQEAEQVQEPDEPEDSNPWRLSNLPIEKPLRP